MTVHTIGHSTRKLAELIRLLRAHGVERLVDVRRWPASRRHPQFNRQALSDALGAEGLGYRHEPDLGGHRKPRPASPHTAWADEGFRAYADHMDTPAFAGALARLLDDARSAPTAILCAEAVPWRCHRQLIADALVAQGVEVRHILGPATAERHTLHPAARLLDDGRLLYEGPQSLFP